MLRRSLSFGLPLLLVLLMLAPTGAWGTASDVGLLTSDGSAPPGEAVDLDAEEAASRWNVLEATSAGPVALRSSTGVVELAVGAVDPTVGSLPSGPLPTGLVGSGAGGLLLMQLHVPDERLARAVAARHGLALLEPLHDSAWLVRASTAGTLEALAHDVGVRWSGVYEAGWRVDPALWGLSPAAVVDLVVVPAPDLSDGAAGLSERLAAAAAGPVWCDAWQCRASSIAWGVAALSTLDPDVLWLAPAPVEEVANDDVRRVARVVDAVANSSLTLDGAGQVIVVTDTGLDEDHGDFDGRVRSVQNGFGPDDSAKDRHSGHGTHVMATLLGDGSGDANTTGVAPGAEVIMYQLEHDQTGQIARWGSLYDLMRDARTRGATVSVNAWGAGNSSGTYSADSRTLDLFARDHHDMLIVFSAGDDPSANGVTPPSTAKSALSVGASTTTPEGSVWNGSSLGPTLDGRIKPDLVAPGTDVCSARAEEAQFALGGDCSPATHGSGTPLYMTLSGSSMATAATGGAATLARQHLVDEVGIVSPSSDLLRAMLINGATDLGTPGPDADAGWGQLDLAQAIEPAHAGTALDVWVDANGSLEVGWSYTYTFDLDMTHGLMATLAWNDVAGSSSSNQSAPRVVNDLDLVLTAPNGTTYLANHFSNGLTVTGGTPDRVNTIEQVRLASGQSGNWSLTVRQVSGGDQRFAIVVHGLGVDNHGVDLAVLPTSLSTSITEPQADEAVVISLQWINQAPVTSGSFNITLTDITLTDITTAEVIHSQVHDPMGGGTDRTTSIIHRFATAGLHTLRLMLDSDSELVELNDELRGVDNNWAELDVNVTALGVRLTPLTSTGEVPITPEALEAAHRRVLDPKNETQIDWTLHLQNTGTSSQEVDVEVSPVLKVTNAELGLYDVPEDGWTRTLGFPRVTLDAANGTNDTAVLNITMSDDSTDLGVDPPILARPGTYVVIVDAWYRAHPIVRHSIQLAVVVGQTAAMEVAVAGTAELSAAPGDWAQFSLSVRNNGNGHSTYAMGCETEHRWRVQLGEEGESESSNITLEPLDRLAYLPVTVRIQVPPLVDGRPPAAGSVEAIGCVVMDPLSGESVTRSATVEVEPLALFGTDLYDADGVPVGPTSTARERSILSGETTNLTLKVRNAGNIPLNLSVGVQPESLDWALSVSHGIVTTGREVSFDLDAGINTSVRISVGAPLLAEDGDANRLTLRTERYGYGGGHILNSTRFVVGEEAAIELQRVGTDVLESGLGAPLEVSVEASNTGNAALDLTWTVGKLPTLWSAEFVNAQPTHLDVNREVQLVVRIVPGSAPASRVGEVPILLSGASEAGTSVAVSLIIEVTVLDTAWAVLEGQPASAHDVGLDDPREGSVLVTNRGTVVLDAILVAEAPAGWTLTLDDERVSALAVGDSVEIGWTLTRQDGAADGIHEVTIIAVPTSVSSGVVEVQSVWALAVSSSGQQEARGLLAGLGTTGTIALGAGMVVLVLAALVVVLIMRRSGTIRDHGEDLVQPGMGGSADDIAQRRQEALGMAGSSIMSGGVSEADIQGALMQTMPTPPPPVLPQPPARGAVLPSSLPPPSGVPSGLPPPLGMPPPPPPEHLRR